MSDKMVEVAMGIIINAGDARTCAADAMQAELRGDRAAADARKPTKQSKRRTMRRPM